MTKREQLEANIKELKDRYSDIEDKQALFNESLQNLEDFKDELMESLLNNESEEAHRIKNHWEWLAFVNDMQQETEYDDDQWMENELDELLKFLPKE